MKLEADISVEIAYYNEHLGAWEPLVEPIEEDRDNPRWELQIKVRKLLEKVLNKILSWLSIYLLMTIAMNINIYEVLIQLCQSQALVKETNCLHENNKD